MNQLGELARETVSQELQPDVALDIFAREELHLDCPAEETCVQFALHANKGMLQKLQLRWAVRDNYQNFRAVELRRQVC